MSDRSAIRISVGDEVRIHFHPPFPMRSFIEGVVSRIDETLPQGPLIVVDVTRQILLDREVPIRRGHQDFILYERWNSFPEWVEILSAGQAGLEREIVIPDPASDGGPEEASEPLKRELEGV